MKYFYHSLRLWVALILPVATFAQTKTCLETAASTYENGVLALQSEKAYDANGRLVSQKDSFLKTSSGSYTTEKKLTYNPFGNVSSVSYFVNGTLNKKITSIYDGKGRLVREVTENAKGEKSTTTIADSGEKVATNAAGDIWGREENAANADGKPIKQLRYGADGKPTVSVEWKYGANGKVSQQVRQDLLAGNERNISFLYDANGNLTEEVTLNNGEPFLKMLHTFDAKGNPTKTTSYNRYDKEDYVIEKTYSATNKLLTDVYYNNGELISKKVSTYDADDNKIREEYWERGKLIRYTEWTYGCK